MRNLTSFRVIVFWFFLAARSFFSCSYMYLPKSMMRQTGGCAVEETSTRSRAFSLAILIASNGVMMPSCSPWSSITRTSRTRMRSLVRIKRLSIRPSEGVESDRSIARKEAGLAWSEAPPEAGPPLPSVGKQIREEQNSALQRLDNVLFDVAGFGERGKA